MIDKTTLNPVSRAIIPYTPPKSAQEFVDGEIVKKAHAIFEKAIHFHLQECKCLKVFDDDLLKWRYLTNTNPLSEFQNFFSILRNQRILLPLFSFLDRNSLQNLSECPSMKKDVDQYVDRAFERHFGISCKNFQGSANDLSFIELNKMLTEAIKKDVPAIAIEKWISILFQEVGNKKIGYVEALLYNAVNQAIRSHATDMILSLLNAGRGKQICENEDCTYLLELALSEKIATKEIIEALLIAGIRPDTGPMSTMFNALEYGASAEVIETLLEAKARVDLVKINDAIDCNASAKVIRLLLDAGLEVDVTRAVQIGESSSIHRALRNGASFEIIKMLLDAGASVKCSPPSTVNIAETVGAAPEVIQLLKDAQTRAAKKEFSKELEELGFDY